MQADELIEYALETYDGVILTEAWGERGLFTDPDRKLARGTYFVTVEEADGPNDTASDLDREGVYRVNLGISAESFRSHFGGAPERPAKGEAVATGHDFAALDEILPHPTYGWANWVRVLNPSRETFEELKPLLDEAYERARAGFERRTG